MVTIDSTPPLEEERSKSQKKRDADELQKLGVSLIEWSNENLNQLGLPEHLKQAIISARALKSHGAKRRQAQLIGKLMRQADLTNVMPIFETIAADASAQTAVFHDMEQWRTRLIHEGREALTAFIDRFHPNDLQRLKQLIKKAIDEHQNELNTGAGRALFRHIRSCVK